MEIIIRKAVKKDIPSIISLYSEIEFDDEEVLSLQKAESIFSIIESYPNYHLFIAVYGNEIIGTFALLIMHNLGHSERKSAVVEDVAVAKQWQGKGVGRILMERAMQICKEEGCYKLALSSNLLRENAHKFYESLDFKRHGYSYLVEFDK